MRILHVITQLDPKETAPPAVAAQLAVGQQGLGHDISLLSFGADRLPVNPPLAFQWIPGIANVRHLAVPAEQELASCPARKALEQAIRNADLVHIHGAADPELWAAAAVAAQTGVPYVVRSGGFSDPAAFTSTPTASGDTAQPSVVKMLNGARFVQAVDRHERDQLRAAGLTSPVEVLPNGIFLELLSDLPTKGRFRTLFPKLGDAPFILCVARLNPLQGLDILAEAFRSIAPRIPSLKLVFAGADDGGRQELDARIERYGLTDRIIVSGPLFIQDKLAALNEASLFCHPARKGPVSSPTIRAMAMGLPVVLSHHSEFPEVETAGAGRLVDPDPGAVGDAIAQIMQDPDLHRRMSANSAALVRADYTWTAIARRSIDLYERYCSTPGNSISMNTTPERASGSKGVSAEQLRILHVVQTLDPAAGGPPYIALKLATAQAVHGNDVHMLTYRQPGTEDDIRAEMSQIPSSQLVQQHYLPPESRLGRFFAPAAARAAREMLKRFDVVHMHGVWEPMLLRIASECRRAGVPYVVTTHGMLDPWSLSQSATKKKLALAVGVRKLLNGSLFLHLGNRDERDLIKPLGLTAKHELIPNGVFEHEVRTLPDKGTFRAAFPQVADAPYVLFLSRLHFKKGLDYLADAFAQLAPRLPAVHLVVAGPDGGARADFEQRIATAGLQSRVHVVGPLYGPMKIAAIVDAATFCLPSRQEGFSLAITEALGCGCPCVVSHACHYPEVEEAAAGYCTDLDPRQIADALYKVLSNPQAAQQMSTAGRALVLERFTWPVIADLTTTHYRKHIAHR